MAITITLQAAGDSRMTEDGTTSGAFLAEDDLRRVYGLPNCYVATDNKIYFVHGGTSLLDQYGNLTSPDAEKPPRWDEILPPDAIVRVESNQIISAFYGEENEVNDTARVAKHIPPTTTAFQLRCDSISHDIQDSNVISPMPMFDNRSGSEQSAGTPGQLVNIVIGMGMRSEIIKLSGALVDEGVISASNPRKQVLLNIARLQYLKSGRSGAFNSWGGKHGGPLNPRSYPCLIIFDSDLAGVTGDKMIEPSGMDLSYRGLIKSLSFRQEGGRPNQWFWTMEFQVLQNEHMQSTLMAGRGLMNGVIQINRIRLVHPQTREHLTTAVPSDFPTDGGGDPARPDGAVIEVRTINPLQIQTGPIEGVDMEVPTNWQPISISNSNSDPTIDGYWYMYGIDIAERTFLLKPSVGNDDLDDDTGTWSGRFSLGQTDRTKSYTAFTDGTDAYCTFGGGHLGGKTGIRLSELALPDAFVEPEDWQFEG